MITKNPPFGSLIYENGRTGITVTEPCTCGAKRWFYCECPMIATYDSPANYGLSPTKEAIAYVEAQHPGKRLIYIDGGA